VTDDVPARVRALEDELLAVRCQLGEREAFEQLIARWYDPVWRYARRVGGSEESADEVTQEVWMRVLRSIGRLREPSRLRPWLFGIARRVLMDRLRVKYATPDLVDVAGRELAADADGLDERIDLESMHEALERLPLVEREVLTLFYLQELTLAEVADVLAVPAGTVKSRLFRARPLLRRALESLGGEGDR
jgi:RNA polymerase sigma-70 factor (ECF subfamily)